MVIEPTTYSLVRKQSFTNHEVLNMLIINSPNYRAEFFIATLSDTLVFLEDGTSHAYWQQDVKVK